MNTMPTFMIIDDDDIDVMSMKRSLSTLSEKTDVIVARNGNESLALLEQPEYEKKTMILLLDLNMPQMSGCEFLRNLNSRDNITNKLVFVVSTSTDQNDIQSALKAKVAGYISKEKVSTPAFTSLFNSYISTCCFP